MTSILANIFDQDLRILRIPFIHRYCYSLQYRVKPCLSKISSLSLSASFNRAYIFILLLRHCHSTASCPCQTHVCIAYPCAYHVLHSHRSNHFTPGCRRIKAVPQPISSPILDLILSLFILIFIVADLYIHTTNCSI
jgi:hypothetical protein